MTSGASLAEIKLFAHNISLYGTLTDLTDKTVALRLLTAPIAGAMLAPGTEASILCVSGDSVVSVLGAVTCRNGTELVLDRCEAPERERRQGPRVPCDIPAEFRAIRSDGDFGLWNGARIVDLGKGGLGMLVERHIEVPNRMEVKFHLPRTTSRHEFHEAPPESDALQGKGMTDRLADCSALRAVGRTEHVRLTPSGHGRLGIAFTMMGAAERARLVCFLECCSHAAL